MFLALILVVAFIPVFPAVASDPSQPTTRADCKKGGWEAFPGAGFRNQGDCMRFVQTGTFICRDPLGCVSYDAEDSLRLGTSLVLSGPVGFLGIDELRSVEIAVDAHGPVLGHAVEVSNEDSMCSPGGGEDAANAIVADPTIVAIVGTSCSSAALAAAPIISDAGYSMVSPSNTSPVLTDPEDHAAGYLRVAWNDVDQASTMADFARHESALTSAVVVTEDAYTTTLGQGFVSSFESLGGVNLAFEVADSDGSDVADILAGIVSEEVPDVLYFPVFEPLGSALVTAARAMTALDGTLLATSDSLLNQAFLDAAGAAAEDTLLTRADLSFTDTPEYADFADAYFEEFGEPPTTQFSAYAFDATNVILNGIEESGIVDGDGTLHIGRQALRDALFATAGLDGLTGTINCDLLGDCGAPEMVVLIVADGVIVPVP